MALDPKPIEIQNSAAWQGWVAKDSKDNALATAAKAAVPGGSHYITGFAASYSATKTGLLQIKDGSTVIAEHYVYDSAAVQFAPIKVTKGNAVSAELAASGAGGTIGKVNLTGFTLAG
jgi:hypothetical protein